MSNYLPAKERAAIRSKVLHAAARMFVEKGYAQSTTREIAWKAGVNVSTMNRFFGSKENILCDLVALVLDGQLTAAHQLLDGKTSDMVLYYAAETTLQLYMVEENEVVRELYTTAYTMPRSSELIRRAATEKLVSVLFAQYYPEYEKEDFYELEIASGGIIRGFMMVPSGPEFPMERKVQRFLEASLRIYRVPEEKILEAVEFVKQFDYPTLARYTIGSILQTLEESTV